MKPGRFVPVCLLLLLSMLTISHSPYLPFPPKAAADTISSLYVTPVQNCCISPGPSAEFTVNVMMNLASSELITGFDVRLNYTGFYSPGPPTAHGMVKAVGVDYSNSYFSKTFASGQVFTTASCIDEVVYGQSSGNLCAPDDAPDGQVHFAQNLLGANMTGPVTGALLFSVTFTVNATGVNLMYLERAHLINPGGIPPNPHYIPVTTAAAVFANDPSEHHVAFFDYHSTRSPSVLAGVAATFNASASFLTSSSGKMSLTNPSFVWDFGDGIRSTGTSPILSHTFSLAGNYTVHLNVTDLVPGTGSFERIVQVSRQLGTLQVQAQNLNGGSISSIVTVKLYNLTNPIPPVCGNCTKTLSVAGSTVFVGLSPGSYSMNFTGAGLISSSKVTTVDVGWPTMETVYLQEIQSPPTNYFPLLIFALVIGVGLGLGALALFRRNRSMKQLANADQSARKIRKSALR